MYEENEVEEDTMVVRLIRNIKVSAAILFIMFIMVPVVCANEILGIDISISQNPIPCGGATTVTATIKRAPLGRGKLPLGGIAKLWDHDTVFNDGDDLLDQEHVVLWFNKNTVSFTLRCDVKEGGCELYGPSGESYESGTDIYVSFYEHKSARIYVKCVQVDVDGELAIEGPGETTAGDETNATLSAERAIENATSAHFEVSYDASVFKIGSVEIVHPALRVKQEEGFFSYEENVPGVVSFTLSEHFIPMTLEGPLAELHLKVKNNPPLLWDTTFLKVKEDAVFYNELDEEINVCLGGAYSVFIAPDDTTPPVIDQSRIRFTKGKIIGQSGSVTDDHDSYEQYLTVALYDEHDVLLAEEFANDDGSFLLERFFWLNDTASSKLVVSNGVNLQTSLVFLPEPTTVPYVLVNYQTAQKNNTGKPGETIQISFELLGRSDTPEIYSFMVSDTQGWNLEQSVFDMMLDPMENKTITINITIPASALNATTNTITLTMTSQTYPENSDADSVVVSVYGTYDQPTPDTETPGFQILLPLIAVALVILLLQRKKRHEPKA
jgi:hypothetical protein